MQGKYRERPLQKSMIVTNSPNMHLLPRNRNQQINSPTHSIPRFVPYVETWQPNISSPFSPINHNAPIPPSFYLPTTPTNISQQSQSDKIGSANTNRFPMNRPENYQQTESKHMASSNVTNTSQMAKSQWQQTNKIQQRDDVTKRPAQIKEISDRQYIISTIMQQITEKHMPSLMNSYKTQVFQEVKGLRIEIDSLKKQIKKQNQKEESIKNQIKKLIELINTDQNSPVKRNNDFQQKTQSMGSKKDSLRNFSSKNEDFFELQNKINKVQADINHKLQSMLKEFIVMRQEMTKSSSTQAFSNQRNFRAIAQKSKLPSVLVEHKQTLQVVSGHSHHKNADKRQIVLSSQVYCVDIQGYLLDRQHRYLLDGKNRLIRIEERHLKLLKESGLMK